MSVGFNSFILGGFECSTQRRRDGVRLDVIAATDHDRHAAEDYRQLASYGITTVRDGVRWHLVEPVMGTRDWSSLDPMLAAARETGTQVLWDLLHYGWPDWTNPLDADFVERFAAFAGEAARRIGPGGHYCPINEISFLAWAGGEVAYLNPFVTGRGEELKQALCKAAIAATRRIRAVDPAAVIVVCEPLIAVHPTDASDAAIDRARAWNRVQYDAVDCLLGRRHPEFGGHEGGVDIIGLNYYPQNQWLAFDPAVTLPPERMAPLRALLIAAARHFGHPIFIAETGCEDDDRAAWLTMVLDEAAAATAAGHPVLGVCLYPILDHPGWDDERVCRNGLLCGYSPPGRPAHAPLLEVIRNHRPPAGIVTQPPVSRLDTDMSILLTATFDTRRDADMVVERLVQEFDLDREAIFLTTEGNDNSVGEETDGSDTADASAHAEDREDAALNGSIVVSVTAPDQATAELVRGAYDEFAAAGVVETDPAAAG